MSAQDHLSERQFTVRYEETRKMIGLVKESDRIIDDGQGRQIPEKVSHLYWSRQGQIKDVYTRATYGRQGHATELLNRANEMRQEQGLPPLVHDTDRTNAGEAWARKVGGTIPPRRPV